MRTFMSILLLALTLGLWQGAASAAPADDSVKKVVLQISDPNPFKQTLVLNVANNVIKHYGAENVQLEIVAFGPGLRLLMAGNSNTGRIQQLAQSDVRFSACSNTIAAFTRNLGEAPELNPNAQRVDAGVVRIMDLVADGYTLIKP